MKVGRRPPAPVPPAARRGGAAQPQSAVGHHHNGFRPSQPLAPWTELVRRGPVHWQRVAGWAVELSLLVKQVN